MSNAEARDFVQFAVQAIDEIYKSSATARKAVVRHYGTFHPPYNDQFKRFRRLKIKAKK